MAEPHLQDDPLEDLAAEFIERLRRGEHPSVAEYAHKCPACAEEIRELFPTIASMERLKARRDPHPRKGVPAGMIAPEQLGDFHIVREIGRGGMGVVYEAEQESLGRRVAVKALPKLGLADPQQMRRFRREAQTAANLHHTNIVAVFGLGEHDAFYYIVMQLIRGVGLDEVLAAMQPRGSSSDASCDGEPQALGIDVDRAPSMVEIGRSLIRDKFEAPDRPAESALESEDVGAMSGQPAAPPSTRRRLEAEATTQPVVPSPPEAFPLIQTSHRRSSRKKNSRAGRRDGGHWRCVADIGLQVADALGYAHAHGTLHRDIKPANLLLDAQGVVWITDFGLAKASRDDTISRTGDLAGTLRYMAPERFAGQADPRSDLFSLGLTLYELLTLRPAFDSEDQSELLLKVAHGEPPPPRRLRPDIPRDLETVVLKAIARDPERRYQSAGQLADDLRSFLDDRPIRARRQSAFERFRRWSRRNPVVAALASTVAVLLVIVAVVSGAGYVRAHRASGQLSQALAREQIQRERAESNATLAREVLDRIYTQSAPTDSGGRASLTVESSDGEQIEIPLQPALSEQNAALLENLLAFYDQLAEDAGHDPQLVQERAEANRRAATIQRHLGQYAKAEAAFERTLRAYRQLQRDSSRTTDYAPEIAGVLNELGLIQRATARFEEAVATHRAALDVLEPNLAPSAAPPTRYALARTYYLLGTTDLKGLRRGSPHDRAGHPGPEPAHRHPGPHPPNHRAPERPPHHLGPPGPHPHAPPAHPDPERDLPPRHEPGPDASPLAGDEDMVLPHWERESYLKQAIGLLKTLGDEDPSNAEYRLLLARCYRDFPPGRPPGDTDRQRMATATKLLEQLVEKYPEVPNYRHELVEAYAMIDTRGPLLRRELLPRAEASLRKALALSEILVAQHPDVPEYVASQVHVLHKLADVWSCAGDFDQAEASLLQAVALQTSLVERSPDSPIYRVWLALLRPPLARIQLERGEPEKARALFEESISTLEPFLAREEQLPGIRDVFAELHRGLARTLRQLGEHDAAEQALRRAHPRLP